MKGYKHTKYGTVSINDYGYYRITSTREGNYGKYLHRLIFEDFYGPIPKGCTVHHKDEKHYNLTSGGDSKYKVSSTTKLKMKETKRRKKAHSYTEHAHIDAQIYKEITGEEPKDINIESFFEDGIHFGHQRVWKDDNDVWEY